MRNILPRFFNIICFFKGNDQCHRYAGVWSAVTPFWFTKNIVFGTSHHQKKTDSDENLLCVNLMQYSVKLARLYGCVVEEECKPAELLPVLR